MSIMMRPDSGTKSRAANQGDVHKHINELQQELTRSRAETQRARDKLTCLISLIRRFVQLVCTRLCLCVQSVLLCTCMHVCVCQYLRVSKHACVSTDLCTCSMHV